MDGIYQLPLSQLSETAVVFSRFYNYHREVYVLNLTNPSTGPKKNGKSYVKLSESILDDFFHNSTSSPPKILPFNLKM
jgi:hypothetical protein